MGSIDVADISTPNCDKSDKLISQTSQEQSYDISPYQCSDDEEEEEDDVPNRKFIPTWARYVALYVSYGSWSPFRTMKLVAVSVHMGWEICLSYLVILVCSICKLFLLCLLTSGLLPFAASCWAVYIS